MANDVNYIKRLGGWPEIAILAVAAATRLTLLGMKPPHFDEGVNGWFVDEITRNGFYHYDPTNYHGPLHFYVLFLAQTLLGRHIWALRLPLALLSLASVWLTLRFDRFIGRGPALWAAAAMAVSPGCIFYGRYAIHEYWMVFSLMLCAWGLAGLWQSGEKRYFWAAWIGVTVAVLTKETYFIHFGCAALAIASVRLLGRVSVTAGMEGASPPKWTARDTKLGAIIFAVCVAIFLSRMFMNLQIQETMFPWVFVVYFYFIFYSLCGLVTLACLWLLGNPNATKAAAPQPWTARDMALGVALFAGCVVFFYSGTFMDMAGLGGLYETFGAWFHTGKAGNGHEKPWYYWLELFGQYEWPACIGLLAALLSVLPRTPRFIRALAIYGCGALAAYSIVHYKTPWCIVSLTWPFLMLFGFAADFAIRKYGRPAAIVAASVVAGNLCEAVSLNFFHFTDPKEKYVYVQTFDQVNKLTRPLDALVARNPANHHIIGHIMMESYHPLPWLLGDFTNIGYYDSGTSPPKMDADFLLVDENRTDEVEKALREEYFTEPLTLRDAEDPAKLYLNAKTFRPIFPGRKADFIPKPETSPSPTTPAENK